MCLSETDFKSRTASRMEERPSSSSVEEKDLKNIRYININTKITL